ncbi:MAG: thioredoxin-disulfide reductase [Muribaculaceae bacterium]|nr:thioredoxin-disulfide reductase [Muribaculaceae bacterium]
MSEFKTKCLIIGSGPAGYTAAIYASRANLSPILVEGYQPGGQLTTTTEVENFPGYVEGVSGPQLMDDLRAQAARYGAQIIGGEVTEIDLSKRPFVAKIDGSEHTVEAETVIISTGASAKYLGLDDEKKYMGMGVSACATCDGFFYRKKVVAVVGGGDTACEEALYLSNLASKVFMIVRKDYLRASKVMQQRVLDNPKIEVLFNTVTKGLFGEEVLRGATVVTTNPSSGVADTYNIDIDGFFLGIGHKPNTAFLRGQIELDDAGYIVTMPGSTATNVEGVYAAGDVADPTYKQAISAAGMGCRAALDAERYITLHQEA